MEFILGNTNSDYKLHFSLKFIEKITRGIEINKKDVKILS